MIHYPKQVGVPGMCTDFCAYHGSFTMPGSSTLIYTAIIPDFSPCCGYNFAATTIAAAHEIAEAITDPESGTQLPHAWKGGSKNEIGDGCEYGPAGQVFYGPDGYKYQIPQLWSNVKNGCVDTCLNNACGGDRNIGHTDPYPVEFLGLWSFLANGYAGELIIHNSLTQEITFNNGPLPSGQPSGVLEVVKNLLFKESLSYGNYYVTFQRGAQVYYAILDASGTKMHGHFTDPCCTQRFPFDAVKGLGIPNLNANALNTYWWIFSANGWLGALSLPSKMEYFDNNQLPNGGTWNPAETNVAISVIPQNSGLFIWWQRNVGAAQQYTAIVDIERQNFHGFYHDSPYTDNNPHPVDGTILSTYQSLPNSGITPCWAVLVDGWVGDLYIDSLTQVHLTLYWHLNGQAGSGQAEVMSNVKFNSFHSQIELTFFRSCCGQTYYALFNNDLKSFHGHFSITGSAYQYPFDGTTCAFYLNLG